MKTIKLCQYCKPIATLVLWACVSLLGSASAAVIASTDFEPKVNPGDSIPWDLISVKQGGISGNALSSSATYSGDGKNYRTGATNKLDFVYCVTNNPSILNPDYMETDESICVIQYAGTMAPMTSFFTYDFGGLKEGENFTVTLECYFLNNTSSDEPLGFVMSLNPAPAQNSTNVFSYKVSGGGTNDAVQTDGTVSLRSTQKKITVTVSGKATSRDMSLVLKFPYYGKKAGYALGITSIKVEGTLDPFIRSSQGLKVCEGEQTVLTLDKEYNAKTYSWQRKDGNSWKEIGSTKSVIYELKNGDEVFRCLVGGDSSNVMKVESIVCCVNENNQPTSRQTLLWETFGRFTAAHTYVDKDGNVSQTPSSWPDYRQDVSYDIPSHGFDDGVTECSPKCSCNNPSVGNVDDGYYAIVTPTPNGFPCLPGHGTGQGYVGWMDGVDADHTSEVTGESRGGALAINVDEGYVGVVFEAVFPDICEGKDIFYETWFANATGGTEHSPKVTVRILDAVTGELLDEIADIEAKRGGGWTPLTSDGQRRFHLQGSGKRSIKMQVLSTSGSETDHSYWKQGNDLIIDDIKFMVCSPPSLEAYSDIATLAKDSTICSDMEFVIDAPVSEMLENFFGGNHKFLFQYSGDMGNTWRNISGLEDRNEFTINTFDYRSDDKMQFRVVVATPDVLGDFVTNPNKADITDACRNYSITEPFTITRAGDLDLGATVTTSACVAEAVTLNAPNTLDFTEVVAWGWSDESGNAVVALSDDQDNLSYEIAHKSAEKETYYFNAQTADGCKGNRKYEIDVKPTVEFDYDKVEDCGLTTFRIIDKTPTDAAFVWTYNGDDYPGDEFTYDETMLSPNEEPTTMKYVELLGTATGYCDNFDNAYQFILKPIPGEPAVTTPSLSFVMEAGSSASVKAAATAEPDHTLEWVPTLATTSSAPVTGWSSDEPFVSLDYDSTYFFFVRQVNEYGCEGPAVNVNVQVSSAKRPYTRDTTVCLNEVVDLNSLAQKTDNIYELNWYDELGNLLPEAPSVPTNVPGVSNFYVTQKSTEIPYPESKVDTLTVEVVGVYTPDTIGNTYHYCSDDQALPLVAKLNKDESQSFYADKVIWSVDGGSEGESVPTVNTHVSTTANYKYTAYQTYTIKDANQNVCKGEAVNWNVEVTYVPALETDLVTYMKADANSSGTFDKDVMTQSGNAAIRNYASTLDLWWYETDCSTKIGSGKTAPTPSVDPNVPAGTDDTVYYCVRQEVDGCLSEGTQVEVLISDAPKPYPNDYAYCRGATSEKMTTKPDTQTKPGDYILKWYGNGEKGDYTDLHLKGDEGPAPTTNMRGGDIGKSEYYYYVTQTELVNGAEGAESKMTEIKVTIYDQPAIAIDNGALGAVCKPEKVDIENSVSQTNEVANLDYNTNYYVEYTSETQNTPLADTKVGKSGTYYVVKDFTVKAKANEATCVSTPTPIPVTVDTLEVLVQNVGTCPNMTATFTVTANTNTTGVKYTWNGLTESDANGGTSTNATFVTKAFAGADYGDEFLYSLLVEAGTCKWKADTMKVTLGEGPVTGTMTITEDGNSYVPNTFTDTKANEFYSCGAPLTIHAGYHDTDGNDITDYKWYDGTTEVGQGADLPLPEVLKGADKTYRVEFTNGCPTSVTISIHYRPITAKALSTKLTKVCEGDKFTAEVETESPMGETPSYTWFRNGAEVQMGGGTSLDLNQTKLTIEKTKTTDSGRYTFLMTNRGCVATAELDSLVVKPYIVATERIDTIVNRHSNPNIEIEVTVPAGGKDANGDDLQYDWKGTRGEHETTNPLSLSDVTSDHYYDVTLSGEDLCDAKTIVDLKVDAQLMLKTFLKDTICTGLSAVLVIDTTGTGKFRHEDWNRSLEVWGTTGGNAPVNMTESVTQDGNLLKLTVSPTSPATYEVRFHYGPNAGAQGISQDTVAKELLYVIPAIGVTIPEAVTLCEGEATDIVITDIQPEGTVIKWNADTTILTETLDTSAVTVKPVYLGGTNHQYQYAYDFVAYNRFCNSSVPYTAYVKVDEPLEGEILGDHVICETFSSRLDASSYGATTYVWTLEGDTVNQGASMTVSPKTTAHYHLSMGRGVCQKDDDFLLTVKTNPVIVDVDSVDIRGREIILKDGAGEEPFNFWVDDLVESKAIDPVLYNLQFSKHIAHVVDKNGCVGELTFEVLAPPLTIPPYFTPNADGINDGWLVVELPIVYPNAVVKIYDRFGKLVAEYKGAKEDGWDGTYNGHAMPSTDYWYVIDVEEIDRQFMGHFTLLRQ